MKTIVKYILNFFRVIFKKNKHLELSAGENNAAISNEMSVVENTKNSFKMNQDSKISILESDNESEKEIDRQNEENCIDGSNRLQNKTVSKSTDENISKRKRKLSSIISENNDNPTNEKRDEKSIKENKDKQKEGIVTGKRAVSVKKIQKDEIEYLGEIKYASTRQYDQPFDEKYYPIICIPFPQTNVLKYDNRGAGIQGVSEPIIYKQLFDFIEKAKEQIKLEISNNFQLPIKDRSFFYEPDISLFIEELNLFVDIEVDEPYDGITRKPIHYKGCKDDLRNLYFIQNGSIVVRFTEEQVFLHSASCVKKIAEILDLLIKPKPESRLLNLFENTKELISCKQWTYQEAIDLEKEKFRESYLKIEFKGDKAEDYIEDTEGTYS